MGDTRENSLAAREGMGLQHKGTDPSAADPPSALASFRHELALQLFPHTLPPRASVSFLPYFCFRTFSRTIEAHPVGSWVSAHRAVWTPGGVTPWCDRQPSSTNTQASVLWRDNSEGHFGSWKQQGPVGHRPIIHFH